jgi:YVTN family beta-propeller protein
VPELPTGTVTFLFTDLEGSTSLLKQLGRDYGPALAEHQRILRGAFAAHRGHEVDTQGDSFFVAFRRAKDAVAAAVDAQHDLAAHTWPDGTRFRVRMGLHTGEPQVGEQRYVGIGVHKAARIGAAGHGGQVLLSSTTRELVEDELPTGVTIRDLGNRRLKDIERPERLFQLEIEDLPSRFGPLKTLDVELRRKRRRMYLGAALIGVLAAAVAIPVFALGQGSGGSSANVAPNSLAVIDPVSNKVVDAVPNVGVTPSAIDVGAGSVWVGNLSAKTLSRVDPTTKTLQGTIPLEWTATGVAVGAGSVWTANGYVGSVSTIDPSVGSVSTIPDLAPPASSGVVDVGEGGVWFVSGIGTYSKVDPVRRREVGNGIAGSSPSAVAVGEGSVWIANAGSNNVVRVNPRTSGVVTQITVGRQPSGIAVGGGSVWVSSEADDNVVRIDAASSSLTATIPVGAGPTAVAYGMGAVWVANSDDGTVSRIDPETGDLKTIEIGNRPSGIAVGSGAVWVTVQAPPPE